MISDILKQLLLQKTLTEDESYRAFTEIMEGSASPVQAAAFLSMMRMRKEQPSEITGAARLLREKATRIRVSSPVIADTCGTGGDALHTFNISTAAALLLAAFDICVAKHGNRAVSSRCGSADVLEALGYPIELEPQVSASLLERFHFAFLFAPRYHPAMKTVAPVRKELGFRTIFNIIGPLCNPAGANVQIMGVSDYQLLKVIPAVFQKLGIRGYVFFGEDGMDEITLSGRTYLAEVTPQRIEEQTLYPQQLGLQRCRRQDIAGGDAAENAELLARILQGKETGPRRDIVAVNAAALLHACSAASSLPEGIALATRMLESGKAYARLQEILNFLKR